MSQGPEKQRLLGLLSTTGIACLATGITTASDTPLIPALTSAVVGGISVNLASSYIETLRFSKIREWFIKPGPGSLYDELQETLKRSIVRSLINIGELYETQLKDAADRKSFKGLINGLQKEVKTNLPDLRQQINLKVELDNYLY